MRIGYHYARCASTTGTSAAEDLLASLRQAAENGRLKESLASLDAAQGPFDAQAAYEAALGRTDGADPVTGGPALIAWEGQDWLASAARYQARVLHWMERDGELAREGASANPTKAALELCRTLRDVVRVAVDHGGLHAASQRRFYGYHSTTINRTVVGPQYERTLDLIALIRAGVLSTPLGPAPDAANLPDGTTVLTSTRLADRVTVRADVVVHAYPGRDWNEQAGQATGSDPLFSDRCITAPGQPLTLNRLSHPAPGHGSAENRVWIIGLAAEGNSYYNGYIHSLRKYVRSFHDTDAAVAELLDAARRHRTGRGTGA